MDYYKKSYKWFYNNYVIWEKINPFILNGTAINDLDFKNKVYILTANINSSWKIIDLWCGTWLLLKVLKIKSKYELEPFWIDFLHFSIVYIKQHIFPQFQNNFHYGNIIDLSFEDNFFDYIIMDISLFNTQDRIEQFNKYYSSLKVGWKIFIFIPKDTYNEVFLDILTMSYIFFQHFEKRDGIYYKVIIKS